MTAPPSSSVGNSAPELVARVRQATDLPLCVGLGVSNGAQAAEVASFADGVIVGTAFVQALESGGPSAVRDLAQELSEGIRSATPVGA